MRDVGKAMTPLQKLKVHKIIKLANLDASFNYVAIDCISNEGRVFAYDTKPMISERYTNAVYWGRDPTANNRAVGMRLLGLIPGMTEDDCKELITL